MGTRLSADETSSHVAPLDRIGTALWAISPLNLAMFVVMAAAAVLSSSMGVRAEDEAFGSFGTAAVMAGYYVGFMLGARLATVLIHRYGRRRAFAALIGIAAVAAIPVGLLVGPVPWFVLRAFNGVAQAGMYVVIESWMNGISSDGIRGRLMSLYMAICMAGMGIGQYVFAVMDPGNAWPYVAAAGLYLVGFGPVGLSHLREPRRIAMADTTRSMGIGAFVRRVPVGATLAALSGAAMGALGSMGAVYAKRKDLTDSEIAVFMTCMTLASVLLQWPVGVLADRVSRRAASLSVGVVGAAAAILGWFIDPGSIAGLLIVAIVGGCGFVLYALAAAATQDGLAEHERVAVNGAMMLCTGLGSFSGPLLVGAAFVAVGDNGFYAVLAVVLGLVAVSSMKPPQPAM